MDVAEKIQKEVGDPTILINNAGIVRGKLLLELSEEDVRRWVISNYFKSRGLIFIIALWMSIQFLTFGLYKLSYPR